MGDMSEYPLTVRLFEADLTQPNPDSRVAEYTVSGRRGGPDEAAFVVIDPLNGNECEAFGAPDMGVNNDGDGSHFYWVDEVISGE